MPVSGGGAQGRDCPLRAAKVLRAWDDTVTFLDSKKDRPEEPPQTETPEDLTAKKAELEAEIARLEQQTDPQRGE